MKRDLNSWNKTYIHGNRLVYIKRDFDVRTDADMYIKRDSNTSKETCIWKETWIHGKRHIHGKRIVYIKRDLNSWKKIYVRGKSFVYTKRDFDVRPDTCICTKRDLNKCKEASLFQKRFKKM